MGGSWKWQLRDSGGQWIDMNLSVQFTDRGRVTSGKVVGSPRAGVALVERDDNGRRIELPSSNLTALSGKKPGEGVNLGDKRGTRIKVGDTVTSHGETYEVVDGDWREQRITVVAPDGHKTTIRADSAVVSGKSEKASLAEGAGESTGPKDATPVKKSSPEKKSLNLGDSRGRRLSTGDKVTWDSFLAGSDSYTVTGGDWRKQTLNIMDSKGETRTVSATSVSIIASGDLLYDWSYRIGYGESGSPKILDPVTAGAGKGDDKHDFKNRLQMAKHGTAMKDGSYPISDAEDLHNAIQSFGRAKDPEATKRHIIKRARALKMISALPEKWGVKK